MRMRKKKERKIDMTKLLVNFTIIVKVTICFLIVIMYVSKTIIVFANATIKNHAGTFVILYTTAASNYV